MLRAWRVGYLRRGVAWSDLFKTGDSVTAGRGGLEQVGDGGQEATESLSTRGWWA